MKILFKITSRSRVNKFLETLDNIESFASSECEYLNVATLDLDDQWMPKDFKRHKNTLYYWGYSKNKIDAINRDMNYIEYDWDILVNVSDDMRFIKKDFDKEIIAAFNDIDQFIHYNDGNQKSNVSTMSIMGRKYYERFNYIYHPDYISLWCDKEATEVAQALGKYKYMGDDNILFKHYHPAWGLANYDEQYKKTESFEAVDKQTYLRRKEAGFVA